MPPFLWSIVRVNNTFKYVLFLLDGYNKEIINYRVVDSKTPKVTKNMLIQSLRKVNNKNKLKIHNDQGSKFNNIQVNTYLINKGKKQNIC